MDLNNFDFSCYDINDNPSQENPNFDLNQTNQNNNTPSFTELISGTQNSQKLDIFGNQISLSQLSTQEFVRQTPLYCATKTNKPSSSNKNQCNTKKSDPKKWNEKEDEALMSAWCISSTDSIVGKNQNTTTRWNKVFELYEQARVENQNHGQVGIRSVEAMKNRFKRLNFIVKKWVGCYNQVLNRPPASGTNIDDDIEAAQKLFRNVNDGNDFVDFNVYNNVMSKHQKWCLNNSNFGVIEEVSGSNSKRSRSDMDSSPYSVNIPTPSSINVDIPTSANDVQDINNRPEGREAAKRRKGKRTTTTTSTNSMFNEEDAARLDGVRTDTKAQIELRQRRIEADLKIEEMRSVNVKTKSDMKILNTLLAKQHLAPEDEEMKKKLIKKYMSDL
ncbi:hypothetical protein RND81_11G125000 [Saponaria officinalis]|uniref:No apical meristem-associated C-terminal domain-containing protein n=1 Tax=Saponaria officinalis TaxID=3572 RepID=A0AAW1HN02_SAPOF